VNQFNAIPFNEVGNTRHMTVWLVVYRRIWVSYTSMCSSGSVDPSYLSIPNPFHLAGSSALRMPSTNGWRASPSGSSRPALLKGDSSSSVPSLLSTRDRFDWVMALDRSPFWTEGVGVSPNAFLMSLFSCLRTRSSSSFFLHKARISSSFFCRRARISSSFFCFILAISRYNERKSDIGSEFAMGLSYLCS